MAARDATELQKGVSTRYESTGVFRHWRSVFFLVLFVFLFLFFLSLLLCYYSDFFFALFSSTSWLAFSLTYFSRGNLAINNGDSGSIFHSWPSICCLSALAINFFPCRSVYSHYVYLFDTVIAIVHIPIFVYIFGRRSPWLHSCLVLVLIVALFFFSFFFFPFGTFIFNSP